MLVVSLEILPRAAQKVEVVDSSSSSDSIGSAGGSGGSSPSIQDGALNHAVVVTPSQHQ
ncbi:MAG TPA: hypothetical protein VE223_02350 [Nitrososphaeraceae archaeon]|nr:hypothetical protein [Nitrososphaeraceae archaeon]